MAAKVKDQRKNVPPDERPLTQIQANRLLALSGVSAKELVGRTVAELSISHLPPVETTPFY